MRVSDVVQHADLSIWAEAALILFFAAFVVTAVKALKSDKRLTREMAATPFDDGIVEGEGDEGGGAPRGEGGSR
jgi:hypothetical protein